MNNVQLVGRLARDPETRSAGSTDITTLIVATDRPKFKDGKIVKDGNGYTEKETEFHRVTVFNGRGRTIANHLKKGDQLALQGRIHYTKYQAQDGTDRYGCEIISDDVEFL